MFRSRQRKSTRCVLAACALVPVFSAMAQAENPVPAKENDGGRHTFSTSEYVATLHWINRNRHRPAKKTFQVHSIPVHSRASAHVAASPAQLAGETFPYEWTATSPLEVRDNPDANGRRIGDAAPGTKFTVVGRIDATDWHAVTWSGQVAYVQSAMATGAEYEGGVCPVDMSDTPDMPD